MSAWAEVDRLKDYLARDERSRKREFRSLRQKELGNRLVFAVTADWRFTAHRNGSDVVAYPTRYRVGSVSGLHSKRKRTVEQLAAFGEHGEWCGVRASALLVALDAWREVGCPRRQWRTLTASADSTPAPGRPPTPR